MPAFASEAPGNDQAGASGRITVPDPIEKTMRERSAQGGQVIKARIRPLLAREPLGFELDTIRRVWHFVSAFPREAGRIKQYAHEQGRLLGLVGSFAILVFFAALFYGIVGRKKIQRMLEGFIQPLIERLPLPAQAYLHSLAKILAASFVPLALLAVVSLILAFLPRQVHWLGLAVSILKLWAMGAVVISFLRELLTREHVPIQRTYGASLFRVMKLITLYIVVSLGVLWIVAAFEVPPDLLAFLKFMISLSIIAALLLLLLKKNSILGIMPELPYRSYQVFFRGLQRFYFPAVFLTLLTGLLWSLGYQTLCRSLWRKTWAVAGTFVGVMICYHLLRRFISRWFEKKDLTEESTRFLFGALRSLVLYSTVAAIVLLVLSLLELLDPLSRVMSFPILTIGQAPLSLWIFAKASLILIAFMLFSRVFRAWLGYKIFPALGVEEGLAFAINTFLNYLFFGIGFLFSLRAVGLDLRVLLVFAGAIGIGIGFGLQNMAANLFSSFILVFGRRIKKGDWIHVGDTLGSVRDVGLMATKVWTRDNIELLIPNSELTSHMITNFSLSDPLIRVHVPVGVSYGSDPERVTQIMVQAAAENPNVNKQREPTVWFIEYGNSSLNFELLVWMDVRKLSEKALSSELYYEIFRSFRQAGIEIPFPQRDIHIRSGTLGSKN